MNGTALAIVLVSAFLEPYRLAMERSGCRPEECLVVEDSERGVRAAIAAGIRCIVVPNELTRGGEFAGAWRVFSSCREIPGEIEQLNGKNGVKIYEALHNFESHDPVVPPEYLLLHFHHP
ncbi:MAG: HAD-IA family hydrolase [Syntrophaceae bacterium]|nr:HAD-IA family hydrolase [Pseudomonadota bacterium]MCG2739537.1 HAD-IA family hydrolase [Syntrophaceae bacterium]